MRSLNLSLVRVVDVGVLGIGVSARIWSNALVWWNTVAFNIKIVYLRLDLCDQQSLRKTLKFGRMGRFFGEGQGNGTSSVRRQGRSSSR